MTTLPPERQIRDRVIFYPVAIVAALFCLTIFICIAAAFGDPDVPINRWINRHIASLLVGEAVLLVVVSVVAMGIDRLLTLREHRNTTGDGPADGDASQEAVDDVG